MRRCVHKSGYYLFLTKFTPLNSFPFWKLPPPFPTLRRS
jgi:hypothetical protein